MAMYGAKILNACRSSFRVRLRIFRSPRLASSCPSFSTVLSISPINSSLPRPVWVFNHSKTCASMLAKLTFAIAMNPQLYDISLPVFKGYFQAHERRADCKLDVTGVGLFQGLFFE